MDISVVVVGDEILSGHVQDANAAFIATRVAHYQAIVAANPADAQFLKGWLARAQS